MKIAACLVHVKLHTGYLNTVCVVYMTQYRQAVVLLDTTVAYQIRSDGHCLTSDTITSLCIRR